MSAEGLRLEARIQLLERAIDNLRSVGSMARSRGPVDAGGHRVRNVADAVDDTDAINGRDNRNFHSGFTYLTVTQHPFLPASRRVVAGSNITFTDGGEGGTFSIASTGGGGTGTPSFAFFMS